MSRRIRSNLSNSAAFSLLELVVVLAVLAILAAMIVPMVTNTVDTTADQVTRETLRQLQTVILDRYRIDMAGKVVSLSDAVQRGLPGPDANKLVPPSRTNNHPQLLFLFVNPATNDTTVTFDPITGRGWNGPYLRPGRVGNYPGIYPDPVTASRKASDRGFDEVYGEPSQYDNEDKLVQIGDETVLDGWGNPIVIMELKAGEFYLVSAGPDCDLKTDGDRDGNLNLINQNDPKRNIILPLK